MREIKFRGIKIFSDEYVYGYLTRGDFGLTIDYFGWTGEMRSDIIIEGTESQYTGIKDKHGVEIYEGDKLSNGSGRICVVEWHKYAATYDCTVVETKDGDNTFGFKPQHWSHVCEIWKD